MCDQIEGLNFEEEDDAIEPNDASDKKGKKKAKAEEIARLSKLSFIDIMKEAKDPKDVLFEPFVPGRSREPEVNIPPNIDTSSPLALFELFIPSEMYSTIAENINLYAIAMNASTSRTATNSRYWQPTDRNEIRVFFGVLFYMGIHREPNYKMYWEVGKLEGPIHSISSHISLNRLENLRRYLHVSKPIPKATQVEQTQESPIETQQPQELESPTEEEQQLWWSKIEPLLSTFRTACQAYLILGTDVAIDEIMVRFYSRSSDTCKMPNKPIKQGYKIFALADDGYVWHFQLSSRRFGIAELEKVDELTPTGSMVLQMARLLPKIPDSHYILYLDNYFTSVPLFSMLRKENIGAVGTTRPSGLEFPALLIVLRKKWSTKLDWGATCAAVVNDVLCLGWQDNNFILGLSTVYTVNEASS